MKAVKLKESETLELKRSTSELKEAIISMAAILNKHGHGEIYFGVRNDGLVCGQDVSAGTLREVSRAAANFIEPKIYPKIEKLTRECKDIVHVSFSGSDAPYFAYGRVYMRVGDEDRTMSARELENFIMRKNSPGWTPGHAKGPQCPISTDTHWTHSPLSSRHPTVYR